MKQLFYLTFVTFLFLSTPACENEDKKEEPVKLRTTEISEITSSSAISGGLLTLKGNVEITENGVC